MTSVQSARYGSMAKIYNAVTAFISMDGNRRSQLYFLDHILPDQKVLNIGCGPVSFSTSLSNHCYDVTSVDISQEMINIAEADVKKNGNPGNIKFVCMDIMDFNTREYDVVCANFFLNTFKWADCEKVLNHICSLVKPNGKLCIADEVAGTKITTKLSQFFLRPIIIAFHRLLTGQPFHDIYCYTPAIESNGFAVSNSKRDVTDFLESNVYIKRLFQDGSRS